MKIHALVQGSAEWLQYRATMFNASDAPAMMGKSSYESRNDLLNRIKTGLTKEVDAQTQRRFDLGHHYEALARPLAESIINDDLYPITCSRGKLSASFDGLTMDRMIAFEHKTLNDELRSAMPSGDISDQYTIQMEQQLLISGADKCLFMASKWDENDKIIEELHYWYLSRPAIRSAIIDGWEQFEKDLIDYAPTFYEPAAVADAIMDLPAIIIQVRGELTFCNFYDVKPVLDDFIANLMLDPITDEDFDLMDKQAVKGRKAAKGCKKVKEDVINQTSTISSITRALDMYEETLNANALLQEKLSKSRKEARKLAIMTAAKLAFAEHLKALELEMAPPIKLITEQPDFNGAMKNKRLLLVMQDAADTELARVKIKADGVAKLLRDNLKLYREYPGYFQLFADLQAIIYKPFDDFKLIIESRVEAHKKAENEKMEALRIAIEAEATRKAEAEQASKLEAELKKVRDEEQARINEERRLEQAKQAQIDELYTLRKHKIESDKKNKSVIFRDNNERHIIPVDPFESITIPLSEYDALKADSERLHAIIACWNTAKQVSESALRSGDNATKNRELTSANAYKQKAIDLIELK